MMTWGSKMIIYSSKLIFDYLLIILIFLSIIILIISLFVYNNDNNYINNMYNDFSYIKNHIIDLYEYYKIFFITIDRLYLLYDNIIV